MTATFDAPALVSTRTDFPPQLYIRNIGKKQALIANTRSWLPAFSRGSQF
ncbi:DNA mismatch repair protein [Oceanicaulis alexandrii HTCC2633]|nr:DNA mismatch repair protein [Oceanicaulis alexandrii HTCC2633] [Oceanicaulis sp. HTCC2633]